MHDTEVGEGILDIKSVVKLGIEGGIDWFIVEQEAFSGSIIESVQQSQHNLRRMIAG